MQGILQYAHHLLEGSVLKNETVIDATCGNGNDTLFLSELVGEHGHVLAFDIQEQAIRNTKQLITDAKKNNVSYILDSHSNMKYHLENESIHTIGGAIFNLGYLPKSDKSVITKGDTTIAALDTLLTYLKKNGCIVIVVYHGHDGGKTEKELLIDHVMQLDQKYFNVLQYGFINQKNNPPFILAIEKK